MRRTFWAKLAVLALCATQTGCLTATQWSPRLPTSTIVAIAAAEVVVAAALATTRDTDPNSDWNQTPYAGRAGEVFGSFAAVDLLMFGLAHCDLTAASHGK
jgi:hypothetical protein